MVVMSVTFRRWSKRRPWTCRHCGALVNETRLHAQWHAEQEAGAERWPPDTGQYEGRRPLEVTEHIRNDGGAL